MQGWPSALSILPLLQPIADLEHLGGVAASPYVSVLLPIALLTAAFMVALYYMLGKFLGSPQIDAFAKEEFSQLIISVFIAALWFPLYAIISGIASAAACGGQPCNLFSVAFYSLDTVYYQVISAYIGFLSIELFLGILSSIGFSLMLGTPLMAVKWLSFSPYGGLAMLSNSVIGIIESIGMLLGLVIAREQLLTFFYAIVPGFLLPVGLFMRSLPFTRMTGSSLIAISFAAFFIFPASIVLSHHLMFGAHMPAVYIPTVPTPTGLCVCPGPDGEDAAFEYLDDANRDISDYLSESEDAQVKYASKWYQFSGLFSDATSAIGTMASSIIGFIGTKVSVYTFFDLLKPTTFAYFFYFLILERLQGLVQLAVMVAVTFVLEIIITITGYRAIAAALGGEMEILGLTKVV